MTTLLLSTRHTADDQALWRAAIARGWPVERARGIRVPKISDNEIVIYVEALFGPTIARSLGRVLLEPPEDWLVHVPASFRQRELRLMRLGEARALAGPLFVKPPNDKSFEARVYASGSELPEAYGDNSIVIVSEIVTWEKEFRCFLLDGQVRTVSPYLRNGRLAKLDDFEATDEELQQATEFATAAYDAVAGFTPRAIVMDVGVITGRGWAVVEANGAWGSGIYGCSPSDVLDVIRHATAVMPA